MGDNLRIENLRKDIVDLMNKSQLPIEVIRLTLKEILTDVTQLSKEMIEREKESENEQSLRENKLAE